jgi:hypothetical protein
MISCLLSKTHHVSTGSIDHQKALFQTHRKPQKFTCIFTVLKITALLCLTPIWLFNIISWLKHVAELWVYQEYMLKQMVLTYSHLGPKGTNPLWTQIAADCQGQIPWTCSGHGIDLEGTAYRALDTNCSWLLRLDTLVLLWMGDWHGWHSLQGFLDL